MKLIRYDIILESYFFRDPKEAAMGYEDESYFVWSENIRPASVPKSNNRVNRLWKAVVGEMCEVAQIPKPYDQSDKYLTCTKPANATQDWLWKDKGIWTINKCPEGQLYDMVAMSCRTKNEISKQLSSYRLTKIVQPTPCMSGQCASLSGTVSGTVSSMNSFGPFPYSTNAIGYPGSMGSMGYPGSIGSMSGPMGGINVMPIGSAGGMGGMGLGGIGSMGSLSGSGMGLPIYMPQSCSNVPYSGVGAQMGQGCNWLLAPLVAIRGSFSGYLQCMPTGGSSCGTWNAFNCPSNSYFNPVSQLCSYSSPYTGSPFMTGYGTNIGMGSAIGGGMYGPSFGYPVPGISQPYGSVISGGPGPVIGGTGISPILGSSGISGSPGYMPAGQISMGGCMSNYIYGGCNSMNQCPGYSSCNKIPYPIFKASDENAKEVFVTFYHQESLAKNFRETIRAKWK
ncbi:unnamed protein product [Soboliphyme baturini]|uniref:Chitin-binding type-2 domain-containing protein n=1 Tax=Soboliphyme baturini TaxID=241478 RepID=A0A183IVX2_9BILA|nr:unnamed protein product [Soboliphyme baturini]